MFLKGSECNKWLLRKRCARVKWNREFDLFKAFFTTTAVVKFWKNTYTGVQCGLMLPSINIITTVPYRMWLYPTPTNDSLTPTILLAILFKPGRWIRFESTRIRIRPSRKIQIRASNKKKRFQIQNIFYCKTGSGSCFNLFSKYTQLPFELRPWRKIRIRPSQQSFMWIQNIFQITSQIKSQYICDVCTKILNLGGGSKIYPK